MEFIDQNVQPPANYNERQLQKDLVRLSAKGYSIVPYQKRIKSKPYYRIYRKRIEAFFELVQAEAGVWKALREWKMEVAKLKDTGPDVFLTIAAQSGRLQISTLAAKSAPEDFSVYTYPLPATENPQHRDIVSADVNGDGLLDIVASDPSRAEFLLFRAEKENSLTTAEHFPGLKDMRKLCAGKLGDSTRETIVVLSVEEKLIAFTEMRQGRLTFPQTILKIFAYLNLKNYLSDKFGFQNLIRTELALFEPPPFWLPQMPLFSPDPRPS